MILNQTFKLVMPAPTQYPYKGSASHDLDLDQLCVRRARGTAAARVPRAGPRCDRHPLASPWLAVASGKMRLEKVTWSLCSNLAVAGREHQTHIRLSSYDGRRHP